MSVIERDGHCPTCGQRAGTFTTDEGTSYFLATAEQEASEAAFLREQLRGAVEAFTRLAHPTHTPRGEEAMLVQAEVVGIAQAALDAIEVRSDRITTSRTQAQTIACPRCGAAPGQPCTGARGKPRESMHRERHRAL